MNKKINLDQGTELPEKFILTEEFKKLIMLYKKNVSEHALANIFKTRRTEIRARILKILV